MMRGMNYHIPLELDDGVTWICRIRSTNVSSPPLELQNRIILSEAATLIYLARTKIPVPKVHYVAVMAPTNPVGVGYTIMDRLKGAPFRHWNDVPEDKQHHILEQFVDVFVELEKILFSAIGNLQSPNDLSIGPVIIEESPASWTFR
jgi:aminoglycoside phosphotransferase (APT) family kinase protein